MFLLPLKGTQTIQSTALFSVVYTHTSSQLFPTTNAQGEDWHYQETGSERLRNLPRVTQQGQSLDLNPGSLASGPPFLLAPLFCPLAFTYGLRACFSSMVTVTGARFEYGVLCSVLHSSKYELILMTPGSYMK